MFSRRAASPTNYRFLRVGIQFFLRWIICIADIAQFLRAATYVVRKVLLIFKSGSVFVTSVGLDVIFKAGPDAVKSFLQLSASDYILLQFASHQDNVLLIVLEDQFQLIDAVALFGIQIFELIGLHLQEGDLLLQVFILLLLSLQAALQFCQFVVQLLLPLDAADLALRVLLLGLEKLGFFLELFVLVLTAQVLQIFAKIEVRFCFVLLFLESVQTFVVELLAVDSAASIFGDWVVPEGEELLIIEIESVRDGLFAPLTVEFHGEIIISLAKCHNAQLFHHCTKYNPKSSLL